MWVDFAKKVVDEFGRYVSFWNTFNEPNVYASYGWITGFFPPFKINPLTAGKVVKNMGIAHNKSMTTSKSKFPDQPIGISHNATVFSAENLLGWFPARLSDWWFMEYVPSHFEKVDFFGMSYYGRIPHDPSANYLFRNSRKNESIAVGATMISGNIIRKGYAPAWIVIGLNTKSRSLLLKMECATRVTSFDFKPSRIMLILFTRR